MSYTSNSEFDANRRVQITNEIPPYDYYDGIHSVLTDDMWKWLLGYSRITFDLPDEETVKETGALYDTDDYFHKIVNGQLSTTYGPKTTQVWDETTESYKTVHPEYHSMEVYGILLPEEDLFLHEIYRYLECLYPDHPDWANLLTNNEINDLFTNAAHMVDYDPDNIFFEKVATSLSSSLTDTEIEDEAFKIKYRNLTNNAFRRKLYGSRFGYNMFVHDIFQTCSIFPMGTYIPIKPVYKQFYIETTDENGNIVKTIKTYDEYPTEKVEYNKIKTSIPEKTLTNRFIDTYDSHYYNKFRLIDWTGESNSYTKDEEEDISIYAYTIPDKVTTLFEFPPSAAPVLETSMALNDLLLADNSTEYLTINDINYDIAHKIYSYVNNKWSMNYDGTNLLGTATVSFSISPSYIPMYKTENEDISSDETAHIIDTSDTETQPGTNYSFIGYLSNENREYSNIDIVFDPYVQGRIYLRPSQILSYYRDNIKFSYTLWPINDDVETPYVIGLENDSTEDDAHNWPPLNINSKDKEKYNALPLKYNDMITNANVFTTSDPLTGTKSLISKNLYMAMVSGFNSRTGNTADCGHFYISNTLNFNYNYDEPSSLTKRAIFGIRITTCNNEQVVLLGQIDNLVCEKKTGYRSQPITSEFYVKAIPEYKDEQMLEICYGKKDSYTDRERANRALLYNDDDTEFTLYESFKETETAGMEVLGFLKLVQVNDNGNKYIEYASFPEMGYGTLTSFDFGGISTIPLCDNSILYTADDSKKTINITADQSKISLTDEFNKSNISLPLSTSSIEYLLNKNDGLIHYNKIIKNYEDVTISSTIDISDESTQDLISFTDDTSRELFKTLSIGDTIRGPSIISENLYITELLTNQVRVSEALTKSGTFDLIYHCKMNYTSTDTSTEFAAYRKKLFNNGNLVLNDPFTQTLWPNSSWPNTSLSFLNGYTDTSLYSPFVGWSEGSNPIPYLTEHVIPAIHGSKAEGTKTDIYGNPVYSNQIIPCSIKLLGDLFVDLNLNRTYNIADRQGTTPTLNTVDWLDYMCDNANELSRASDNVSFGTQLLMETDTSGLYSLLQDVSYTDPTTHVKFQTFNWKSDTVPVYAQIGIGGSNYEKYWKDLNDVTYPTIYGNAIYDGYINAETIDENLNTVKGEISDISTDYEDNGGRIKTRHIYTDYENRELFSEDEVVSLNTIDNPIAEIPLGEYDIQMHYRPTVKDQTLDVMTVQINVYKQEFSNINQKLEDQIKIMSYKLENPTSDVFLTNDTDKNCLGETSFATDDTHPVTFKCMGEWTPSVTYSTDGTCTINWPSKTYSEWVEGTLVNHTDSLLALAETDNESLIAIYKNNIIPYYIVNTGNTYHNVVLDKSNDICNRYIEGSSKGINVYDDLDTSKTYTVQIKDKSILTIEPEYKIVDNKLKLSGKFRWTNKSFKFAGGIGKIRTSEDQTDTFDTLVDAGLSTTYTETLNGGNYVNALLKKSLGSIVRFSKDNYSVDYNAKQWTGYAYYCPEFNGITYNANHNNSIVHMDNTIVTQSYLNAFNRFYNKSIDVSAESTDADGITEPYYTWSSDRLHPYFLEYTDNVFFVHALQADTLFKEGDIFCLYPIYKDDSITFTVAKLDKTLHFVSTLPLTQDVILDDEFELFLDENCYWQKTISNYTNEIQLPRSFIADGSYKVNLVLNPNFEGSVYDYDTYINYLNGTNINEETGLNEEPSSFTKIVTNSTIKYDEDYDIFYITEQILDDGYYTNNEEITDTSNTISLKKYVIKFNENKFFKNAKYITGKYQLVKTIDSGTNVICTPTLSATDISGMQFNISDLTVSDKILSASLVQLRSNETESLKPQFFNNYREISGQLDEIGEDYIKLSYDTISRKPVTFSNDTDDPLFKYATSSSMITSLQDLLPAVDTYDSDGNIESRQVYDDNAAVTFTNGYFDYLGNECQAPTIVNIEMSHVKEYSGVDVEFKYYKNLLVFEGQIYLSEPNTIYAGSNSYTTSAFSEVQTGDRIVDIAVLSSKNKQTVAVDLYTTENDKEVSLKPDYVIFTDNYLFAAKGTELYMAEGTLSSFSASSKAVLDKLTINYNGKTSTSIYPTFDNGDNQPVVTNMGIQSTTTGKSLIVELSISPNDTSNQQSATTLIKIPLNTIKTTPSASLYSAVEVDTNGNAKYVDDTSNNVVTLLDWRSDVLKVDSLAMTVRGCDIIHSTSTSTVDDVNGKTYTVVTEGNTLNNNVKHTYYASNSEGYEAIIAGDYIYVKSPTAEVDSTGAYTGVESQFMHWKAAKLPKTVDRTRVKLASLSADEYVTTISSILQMYYNLTPEDKLGSAYSSYTWAQLAACKKSSTSGLYTVSGALEMTEDDHNKAVAINAIRNLIESVFTGSGPLAGNNSTADGISIITSSGFENAYQNKAISGKGASANATFTIPGWTITNDTAYIGSNYSYNVKITNNPLARSNSTDNVALYEEAYSTVINDFIIYVLGMTEADTLIENAKSVSFYDGKLIIKTANEDIVSISTSKLTKRSDIENADNWSSIIYPAKETFSTSSLANSTATFTVNVNGTACKLDTTPADTVQKAFKITCHYKVGNKELYGGYYIDKDTLKDKYNVEGAEQEQSFENFCSDGNITVSQHPFLIYSTDGTAYSTVSLPSSTIMHLAGTGYTSGGSTYPMHSRLVGFIEKDGALFGIIARSVSYANSEVNTYVLSPYVLKISIDDDGELDLTTGSNDTCMEWVTREEAGITASLAASITKIPEPNTNNYDSSDSYEKELSATYGKHTPVAADDLTYSEPVSSTGSETVTFNAGSSVFSFITYSALSLKAENPSVSKCGLQSISFDSDLTTKDSSSDDYITVLVSLRTTADIIDQTQYINPSKYSTYVNTSLDSFKVSDVFQVDDVTSADRMYNKREVTSTLYDSASSTADSKVAFKQTEGYPSTDEDTDRIYYSWIGSQDLTQTTVSKIGNLYYTNKDDLTTLVDTDTMGGTITQIAGSYVWKHYVTTYTPETYTNGFGNTISLCDTDGKFWVQQGDDVPRAVQFASLSKLVYNNIPAGNAYPAPKPTYETVTSAQNDPDLREDDTDITTALSAIKTTISSFSIAQNDPYVIIKITKDVANTIKSWVKGKSTSEETYYSENNNVMTISDSFNRFVSFRASIPYIAYNSPSKLSNNRFAFEDETNILTDASGYAVNGVYIPIKGYGGTYDNTNAWTKYAPWELDPTAFEKDSKGNFIPMVNSFNEPVYLCDKHGVLLHKSDGSNIRFMTPKYHSLKELVQYEDYEIMETVDDYTAHNNGNNGKYLVDSLYTIKSIGSDNITFTDNITFNTNDTNIDINDGDEHIICLKLLTVNPITLDFMHMNNSDYIVEIPLSATETYGYDRVYWDDKGYPKSPITINNVVYRAENNDKYNTTNYTCSNGATVYECNEDGKYITYTGDGTDLTAHVLGDDTGSIVDDLITVNNTKVDPRVQPKTPRYESCQDWFKNEYYIAGQEKNPFWQIIQFTSKYDVNTMKYSQVVDLYSYVKSANTMYLDTLDASSQYVLVKKAPSISISEKTLNITSYDDYVDCKDGTIKFILTQNYDSDYYKTTSPIFVKYGIVVTNPKYDSSTASTPSLLTATVTDEKNNEIKFADDTEDATSYKTITSFLNASYSVNTTENFVDPSDKDAAIISITEMGLFDKNHKLIAYANFPPIEYRTDTQHVDFTAVISYTNLTELTDE